MRLGCSFLLLAFALTSTRTCDGYHLLTHPRALRALSRPPASKPLLRAHTRLEWEAETRKQVLRRGAAAVAAAAVLGLAQPQAPASASASETKADAEARITDVCYLDIEIDGKPAGRVNISLFGDAAPLTVDNFKKLCSGSEGYGYQGSSIFRVVAGLSVQGGNIPLDDGASGPAYSQGKSSLEGGRPFDMENFDVKHAGPGIVSMMRTKDGKADSRFFFTLSDAPWADGKYCAFGRVTGGMEILRRINNLQVVGPVNKPSVPVTIRSSGLYVRQALE